MAKTMKENKIAVQKGPRLDSTMKTMKTMSQDEKLAEKHQQVKDLKSAGTLKTHMPKQ